jgi:hypothetical protein
VTGIEPGSAGRSPAVRCASHRRTRFGSFGPPSARARIWFGLRVTGSADAPGTAESGSSIPVGQRKLQGIFQSSSWFGEEVAFKA